MHTEVCCEFHKLPSVLPMVAIGALFFERKNTHFHAQISHNFPRNETERAQHL
jgi:hypothetical protein